MSGEVSNSSSSSSEKSVGAPLVKEHSKVIPISHLPPFKLILSV